MYVKLAQCSTETPDRSALLGGEQGPQDQKPTPALVSGAYPSAFLLSTSALQFTLLDAEQGPRKCYTAASHLRLPAGWGSEVVYSMLILTQARKAFISPKTAFGKTT